jgi:hypothetical protein
MPPCHTQPFIRPGVVIDRAEGASASGIADSRESCEQCDYCGAPTLEWRKCKLVCASCRQINKSCADL